MTHATTVRSDHRNAGYTIVEMMIVMTILIIVMALVIPVIGGARNTAKKTNTQQILSNLGQASQQFELQERRLPGYFSESEMGHQDNAAHGFSSMQNLILDLCGGVYTSDTPDPNDPNDDIVNVGPRGTNRALVRLGLIAAPVETKGVVNKGYFTPDPKYFIAVMPPGSGISLPDAQKKHFASDIGHLQFPDLIDGFGQPILAWRQDRDPGSTTDFSAMASSTPASFYWNSNAAFLQASNLGQKEQNQLAVAPGENGSMLSRSMPDPAAILVSMQGLLGHPAAPRPKLNAAAPDVPAAARGKLVFHSAGLDGVYLSVKDRGGVIGTASGTPPWHVRGAIDYRAGIDPLENFDDITSAAGN